MFGESGNQAGSRQGDDGWWIWWSGVGITSRLELWLLRIGDVIGMDGDNSDEHDCGSNDFWSVVVFTGGRGLSAARMEHGGDPIASRS